MPGEHRGGQGAHGGQGGGARGQREGGARARRGAAGGAGSAALVLRRRRPAVCLVSWCGEASSAPLHGPAGSWPRPPAWSLLPCLQAAEAANREVSGDTDEDEEFEEGMDVDVDAGPALAV